MPIYTYACQTCGGTLEKRQSFSDEPLTTHDECGGSLRRVIHPAGIVFKGSGFYNTDYKHGSNGKRSESTESSTSDAAKSESSTSESGSSSDAAKDSGASKPTTPTPSSAAKSEASSSSTPAPSTP